MGEQHGLVDYLSVRKRGDWGCYYPLETHSPFLSHQNLPHRILVVVTKDPQKLFQIHIIQRPPHSLCQEIIRGKGAQIRIHHRLYLQLHRHGERTIHHIILIPYSREFRTDQEPLVLFCYRLSNILLTCVVVYYIMGMLSSHLILILLLFAPALGDLSPGPKPFCASKSIPNQLPITIDQVFTVDLTNYFVGYNLDYTQLNPKPFAFIKPNFFPQASTSLNLFRIISNKITHNKNAFGNTYFVLAQLNNETILTTGYLRDPSGVPSLQDPILVEEDVNVVCFDAEVFADLNQAIVDCVKTTPAGMMNLFYYVDISTRQVKFRILNDRYVEFPVGQRRKLIQFKSPQTGYPYLIRAYLRSALPSPSRLQDNTYVEIFSAKDLDEMETLSVIDRSTLGLSRLSISDLTFELDELIILDFNTGVYRLTLNTFFEPKLKGFYSCRRFLKLAVYSDDLQEQYLVAIANSHAVHEIDWEDPNNPDVVTKYSLISNTRITTLSLNLNFVIVTGSSLASPDSQIPVQYNYTWIFSKQSRSFTNSYRTISYNASDTFVHFDYFNQYLLVTNRTKIVNYDVNRATLILNQFDGRNINSSDILQLRIVSKDSINPKQDICDVNVTIHFVERKNISLWSTDIATTEQFFSNYPGDLTIPLRKYAFGPNITYRYVKPFNEKLQPANWVHKKNLTKVQMSEPLLHPVNYLRTEVTAQYGVNNIIAYYQDTTNKTYLAFCRNQYYTSDIHCNTMTDYQHSAAINSMATGFIQGTFGDIYVNVYNLKDALHRIYIYEFGRSQEMAIIEYPEGFEGHVTDLDITNGLLYVTLPSMKRIDGYRLSDCTDTCTRIFELSALQMQSIGVTFFSPVYLTCTRAHPQVLFISNLDSIIIVDVDNHNNIRLLTQLTTTATSTRRFQVAANKNYLYVVSAPTTVEQYKFQDLYKSKILKHKYLQLYHYTIPDTFDMEFNDIGNLFYITAIDVHTFTNAVLVFESGQPLVSSLYDVIFLQKLARRSIELEVSGTTNVDFVTIIIDEDLRIVKMYEQPEMIIRDVEASFGFYLQLENSEDSTNATFARVIIANYPDNFNKSINFPSNTVRFVGEFEDRFTWSDHGWFQGNIIGYDYKCQDCPDKIEFISHIEDIRTSDVLAHDFYNSVEGGYILWDNVMKLNMNGTIYSSINIPKMNDNYQDVCERLVSEEDMLIITACTNPQTTVSLYVSSNIGYKPFTMGPWKTDSKYLTDLQLVNGLLMLVDVNPNPALKFHSGGIYLYTIGLDNLDEESRLEEIDYIDNDDLAGAATWDPSKPVFVGNAYLNFNNHYRLYATEQTAGIFITTFDWLHGDPELNIKVVDYINIPQLLAEYHFSMPSDATFGAITVLQASESGQFQIQNILITTSNFHHFEIKVVYYKSDGRIGYTELVKVYYRYGYYDTYNRVRAYNGFVVIPYVIPVSQEKQGLSKQQIAIYDSRLYSDDEQTPEKYYKRYIMAAQTLETRGQSLFNFNRTQTSKETAGLVIVNPLNKTLFETIVNRNLTIIIKDPDYYTQNLFLWPYSDFYRYMFEFKINGLVDSSLKGWQIALIVIGSLLGGAVLAVAVWFSFKKLKVKWKQTILVEEYAEESQDTVQRESEEQDNKDGNQFRVNNSMDMRDTYQAGQREEKQLSVEIKSDIEEVDLDDDKFDDKEDLPDSNPNPIQPPPSNPLQQPLL